MKFAASTALALLVFVPSLLFGQWQQRDLAGRSVHALLSNAGTIYAGTDTSGFFVSTNEGSTWTQRNTGLTQRFVKTFAVIGNSLFAGTNGAAGVYLSTNEGGSWTIANSGILNQSIHALAFNGASLLAASDGGGIYISTNNGTVWQASIAGLTNLSTHAILVTPGRIFVGGGTTSANGGVFISTDNGASWTRPATSPNNVRSLAMVGTDIFAATNGAGVYRSTDDGATWSTANFGLTALGVRVVLARGNNLLAGTMTGGVFLTTDRGTSWNTINDGLTPVSILSLEASATTLFAGTQNNGVWTRPLSQVITGVNTNGNLRPDGFHLQQNFPNPFNPTTTIRFTVPQGSTESITLRVFDALGKEMALLVDGNRPAGTYSVTWSANAMASGMYFVRLTSGEITLTRRMVLMK
jgi:hypothetical protein